MPLQPNPTRYVRDLLSTFQSCFHLGLDDYVADRVRLGLKPMHFQIDSIHKVENAFLISEYHKTRIALHGRRRDDNGDQCSNARQQAWGFYAPAGARALDGILNHGLLVQGHPLVPPTEQMVTDDGYYGSGCLASFFIE